MKILAVILSFYLILLSILPCADIHVDLAGPHPLQLKEMTSDNHHDFDQCSPFCGCHCCQASINFDEMHSDFSTSFISFGYPDYFNTFRDIEIFEFLIPPKA